MDDSNKKRFAELITGLALTFTTDISAREVENYWRFLNPFPLSQIEQAIMNYCASADGHKFMPKPGEIVAELRGKNNELSLMAWTKVTKAIRKAGASKTVVFDDKIIHAAIDDIGGWIRLCGLSERELTSKQREFERLYACYLNRSVFHYPRQLTGLVDRDNAAAGYQVRQKPLLFGNALQAALVFKNGDNSDGLHYRYLTIDQIFKLSDEENSQKRTSKFPEKRPQEEESSSRESNEH